MTGNKVTRSVPGDRWFWPASGVAFLGFPIGGTLAPSWLDRLSRLAARSSVEPSQAL